MVFYECVVTAKHTAHFKSLTEICKTISKQVVQDGGIVTSIRNHGVREFPHRFQVRYPDYLTQQRYYTKGRSFSVWYESNPNTQAKVSNYLERQLSDDVLRYSQLRSTSKLGRFANLPDEVVDASNSESKPNSQSKSNSSLAALYRKNPYVKRALLGFGEQE